MFGIPFTNYIILEVHHTSVISYHKKCFMFSPIVFLMSFHWLLQWQSSLEQKWESVWEQSSYSYLPMLSSCFCSVHHFLFMQLFYSLSLPSCLLLNVHVLLSLCLLPSTDLHHLCPTHSWESDNLL